MARKNRGRTTARSGSARASASRERRSTPSRAKSGTKRSSASASRTRSTEQSRRRGGAGSRSGTGARTGAPSIKWIESSDEHADRPGQTLATRNHDVIRAWAEERGAVPAAATTRDGEPRVLRFDFPGYGGRNLERITWDDWFRVFDERSLVFRFQERLRNGRPSNFFTLERRDRTERRAA